MNKPEPIRKTATISFGPDFLPLIIDLPLSVDLRKADQNSLGGSQVTVLLSALDDYQERVEKWDAEEDATERAIVLSTIWEIKVTLNNLIAERLSAVCNLLHDIRFDHINTDRRREPLT